MKLTGKWEWLRKLAHQHDPQPLPRQAYIDQCRADPNGLLSWTIEHALAAKNAKAMPRALEAFIGSICVQLVDAHRVPNKVALALMPLIVDGLNHPSQLRPIAYIVAAQLALFC